MKKIVMVLSTVLAMGATHAQGIFGSIKIQTPADVNRAYLWDYPMTDSLKFKGLIPGNMRLITMFTAYAKPLYVLADSSQYEAIKNYFADSSFLAQSQKGIAGFEFVVSYVEKFSWQKKSRLNKLEGSEWMTMRAFNEKEKYTMLSQSQRQVNGVRIETGDIVPDFVVRNETPAASTSTTTASTKNGGITPRTVTAPSTKQTGAFNTPCGRRECN